MNFNLSESLCVGPEKRRPDSYRDFFPDIFVSFFVRKKRKVIKAKLQVLNIFFSHQKN